MKALPASPPPILLSKLETSTKSYSAHYEKHPSILSRHHQILDNNVVLCHPPKVLSWLRSRQTSGSLKTVWIVIGQSGRASWQRQAACVWWCRQWGGMVWCHQWGHLQAEPSQGASYGANYSGLLAAGPAQHIFHLDIPSDELQEMFKICRRNVRCRSWSGKQYRNVPRCCSLL